MDRGRLRVVIDRLCPSPVVRTDRTFGYYRPSWFAMNSAGQLSRTRTTKC